METRRSDRSLASAGIVFVVLVVASAVIPGSPPKPSASAVKIARFLQDNGDQIRSAGVIGAFGAIVFLGWLEAVWRLMRDAEGGVAVAAG